MTQRFITNFNKLSQQYEGKEVTEEKLYQEAIDLLKKDHEGKKHVEVEVEEEPVSLSTAFKAADEKLNVKVKDIFKD